MAINLDRITAFIFLISLLLSLSLSWVVYNKQDKFYIARFEIYSQSYDFETENTKQWLKKIEEDFPRPTLSPITKPFLKITPVFQQHTFSPPKFEFKSKDIARFFGERLLSKSFFSNETVLKDSSFERLEFNVVALGGFEFGWEINVLTTSPTKASVIINSALDQAMSEFYLYSSKRHRLVMGRQIEYVDLLIERAKADVNFDLEEQSENKERDYAAIESQIKALEADGKSLSSNMIKDSQDAEISASILKALFSIEKIKLQRQAEAIVNRKVVASSRSLQAISNLEKIKSELQEAVMQPLDIKQTLPFPTQPILRISQNPIKWHQRELGGIFVLSGVLGGLALGSILSLLRLKLAKF